MEEVDTENMFLTREVIQEAARAFNRGDASGTQVASLRAFAVACFENTNHCTMLPVEGTTVMFSFSKGEIEGDHRIDFHVSTPSSDEEHAVRSQTKAWTRGGAMMTVASIAVLLIVFDRVGRR
jgi:hypothetical protein